MSDSHPREGEPFRDASIRRTVRIPSALKNSLRQWRPSRDAWGSLRRRQLQHEYERRREYYALKAEERGLSTGESDVVADIRRRIAARGYAPRRRRLGEIHTFACIPTFSWHEHLLPDLRELGPVTHFDYTALGFGVEELARTDRDAIARRRLMLEQLLPAVRAAHKDRPIDWLFYYGGGQDTSPRVIRQIVDELGIPTVNMSLDDKQGWAGRSNDECRTGAIDITREFDLYITSARVALEWHAVEGGRPIYMPEGFNPTTYRPMSLVRDLPVSFVGAAYGFRASTIDYLKSHRVDVHPFGPGWGTRSVWGDEQVEIFNRSQINLGMGGIEYSESLTNVKTRDFEIPGTGGGAYLTSFNPDLALHFVIGTEILCYRNRDELLELIRYHLSNPDETREIGRRGRERSLREHRWLHRYLKALQILGVTAD